MTAPREAGEAGGPVMAYVAVGSNIEPRRNVRAALDLLAGRVELCGISTFYRTAAIGADGRELAGAEEFLNGVVAVRTALPARAVKFDVLRPIEDRLGRARSGDRYAPRTIDLDLVLYGRAVIDEPDLRLPARDLERPFVAVPLLELAPDLVLPDTRQPLACLWASAPPAGMTPDMGYTRMLKEIRLK